MNSPRYPIEIEKHLDTPAKLDVSLTYRLYLPLPKYPKSATAFVAKKFQMALEFIRDHVFETFG